MHQKVTVKPDTDPDLHGGAAIRTVLTRTADELARNLTDWEQCYDQMSSGSFRGALTELHLPRMQVFKEEISQSVRQTCRVRPGALWFGFPQFADSTRINGRVVDEGCVMVRPGGSHFELLTPRGHAIFGVVVCRDALTQAASRSACGIDLDRLVSAELLRVDPDRRMACMQAIAATLAFCRQPAAAVSISFQQSVITTLLAMLDAGGAEPAAALSFQRRQRVVAKVRGYILERRDQAVSVTDLCAEAHVSRRTLQYCFEDVIGMSPTLYLRRVRLNAVRRQLLDPAARNQPIGSVAADWGFGSFSQFSSDYRKLFGECPSDSREQSRN
jgi:AraC family ethanolamine operon transcriptional activator